MSRSYRFSGAVAVFAVILAAVVVTTPAEDASAASRITAQTRSAPAASKQASVTKKKISTFSPKPGVIFNDANSGAYWRGRILRKIVNSIKSSPRGSTIRIATWSYFSGYATDALIAAHKRGVSVRLVMATSQAAESASYHRLRRALKGSNNAKRAPAMRSFAKTCGATCRGSHGTMHTKLYLFSHAGKSKNVVMWGSPNLTSASARLQWNDLYTSVGQVELYAYAQHIYSQLWADKNVAGPYTIKRFGRVGFAALPYVGTSDWITTQLKTVKCEGATGGTGSHGRTSIQIAQAVIRGKVGNRIATQVKKLWDEGCRIRILYTILGTQAHRILGGTGGRGAVPKRHFVQDLNGDGVFDKYLHLKVLTISGVMGNNTHAAFVMNGSENWADLSRGNDEIVGYFYGAHFRVIYGNWFKYLWAHVPRSVPLVYSARTAPPKDPYANVEIG